MLPQVEDVTASTQQLINGPVAAWQHYTKRIKFWGFLEPIWALFARFLELFGLLSRKEFIAANNLDNELIMFYRKTPWLGWTVVNISQLLNQQIAGPAYGWTTKNGLMFNWQENILSTSPQGDLIHFRGSGSNWISKNISTMTGQKITGSVTRWTYRGDGHIAGIGPGDELVVFSGNINSWNTRNLTNELGLNILGPLTSWVTPNGSNRVPHIAGRTPTGDLIVFWLSTTGDWKFVNVSEITGRHIAGGICNWQRRNGPYLVEHLAARAANGEFLVFQWSPNHDWRVANVSRYNLENINSYPDVYQRRDSNGENVVVIAFKGDDENLFIHWWKQSSSWLAINLTAATEERVFDSPVSWVSYDRLNKPIENVAAQGDDYRLLIFNYDQKPRNLVEHLAAPYEGLKRMRGVERDLLVILWDWNDPRFLRPNRADLDNLIFGSTNSLNDYFQENSNGHFSIRRVDVRGWYDAKLPHGDYQYIDWTDLDSDGVIDPNEPQDLNSDGFVNQWHLRYKEAVEMAHADGFPFANYDTNQNGKLSADELGILLITPGDIDRGFKRSINESEYPQVVKLNINGLEFSSLIEVYSVPNQTVGIYAHELGHLYLGHGDMYWELPAGTFMKYAPGAFSVMDQHGWPPHYDPFAKMKLGWVSPRIILHSGRYEFPAIETGYRVWVLMDPNRGNDEYFLIENRWPVNTYEATLPDSGLAIWHIIEDHHVYNNLPVPPGMDSAKWTGAQGGRQWSRLGVRLIRPVNNFDNQMSLWDGADPATGYDQHLRWADGTPSGFEIRSISAAGNLMSADIVVPF